MGLVSWRCLARCSRARRLRCRCYASTTTPPLAIPAAHHSQAPPPPTHPPPHRTHTYPPPTPPHLQFLLLSKAGSHGINLVSCQRVVVLDEPWNPVYNAQVGHGG